MKKMRKHLRMEERAARGRQQKEVPIHGLERTSPHEYGTTFTLGSREDLAKCSKLLVAMRLRETPVPIPNTKVKT